jgi:hypothetical protein
MEVRQFIRPDVAVSAIAHVSILALVILFSEVDPFGAVTAEPMAVDLVTPDEVEKKPEPAPTPQPPPPDVSRLTKLETPQPRATPAPAPQAADPPPQPQTARPNRQDAVRPPQAQPPSPPPAPSPTAGLGYTPAQPDLTVKYNVMLGLPPELPPAASAGKGSDKDFDATASTAADLSSSLIAEFRRHLKTCSKLPASVASSDNLVVKLRVLMTPDGRLAADPLVGGGSANPKALDLLRSAIDALRACQPYAMLPADRYGEWKVLDLNFTPRDFSL